MEYPHVNKLIDKKISVNGSDEYLVEWKNSWVIGNQISQQQKQAFDKNKLFEVVGLSTNCFRIKNKEDWVWVVK